MVPTRPPVSSRPAVPSPAVPGRSLARLTPLALVFIVGPGVSGHAMTVHLQPAAVRPGDSFVITVRPGPGETIAAVRAGVLGEHPAFHPFRDRWQAVAAVGAKTPVGTHPIYLKADLEDGRQLGDTLRLAVETRAFQRQALRVSSAKASQRTQAALERDYAQINPALRESHPRPLWDGPFLQPVSGRISTEYGVIRTINGKESGRHYGVDIAAPAGTPIKAAHTGRVVLAASLEVHGKTVIVDHGCHVFSIYLHCSTMEVEVGDRVSRGQTIARVGASGFATGPHLHWGIKVGSVSVRPWNWIESPPLLESASP